MTTGWLLALDVGYEDERVRVAAVAWPAWEAPLGAQREVVQVLRAPPAAYRSGSFYERELPPLLALLRDPAALAALGLAGLEAARAVLVDGHAWLAPDRAGLGARLHEALAGAVPVVGVAKSAWRGSPHAAAVRRGTSQRPLFVTACGLPPEEAAQGVQRMAGAHRLPDLLRRVDALSRGR